MGERSVLKELNTPSMQKQTYSVLADEKSRPISDV